jgi:protein-disulfide isomerase
VSCLFVTLLGTSGVLAAESEIVERVKVDTDGAPFVGPATAPVTLVMFHDYECKYCVAAHATLGRLRRAYGDRLRIVYCQNPYRTRAKAFYAAQAALAAQDFGLFEAFHGKLIENRQKLDSADIAHYVRQIGGSSEDFETAVDSGVFVAIVRRDIENAKTIGATGTPFFFVNGRPLRGVQAFETFAKVIDEEIAGTSAVTRWITRVNTPKYPVVGDSPDLNRVEGAPPAELPKALEIRPLPPSATAVEKLLYEQVVALRREVRDLRMEVLRLRGGQGGHHGLENAGNKPQKPAKRPKPPAIVDSVSLDNDPVLGAADARIAIVEFSEFQCGYCRRFHQQTFPQIRQKYIDTGKVKYVFRDFPLEFHKEAVSAAVAANCAGSQEKYWEMQDALFRDQKRVGELLYLEAALALELDGDAFETCIDDETQVGEVEDDQLAGMALGVRGTPTFFIGRVDGQRIRRARRLVGARAFADFEKAIGEVLAEVEER